MGIVQLHLRAPKAETYQRPPSLPEIESIQARSSGRFTENTKTPTIRHDRLRLPQHPAKKEAEESLSSMPAPSLDMEILRQQARQLGREKPGADTLISRPQAPIAAETPPLLERPVLEALSRRLGRTLVVVEEQIIQDGTRRIRFADNLCLDIPRHLTLGQENPFSPTILLPKACAE